jgi:hypothetical protein
MSTQNTMDVQDFGYEAEKTFSPKAADISPGDRLQFAKWVLRGIFIFFLVSIGVWMYRQSCGEVLLEICRSGLLPIASFVIGDYFGSRSR